MKGSKTVHPKKTEIPHGMSAQAMAEKLFREKGKSSIPELQKLKRANPTLDIDGILHKIRQGTIASKPGKRPAAELKRRTSTVSAASACSGAILPPSPPPPIRPGERQALTELLARARAQPNMPAEALSILAAAMSNHTKLTKAHIAVIPEGDTEALKAKANTLDRLRRTPLFYAVFNSTHCPPVRQNRQRRTVRNAGAGGQRPGPHRRHGQIRVSLPSRHHSVDFTTRP